MSVRYPTRRDFVAGMATIGAGAFLSRSSLLAQAPGGTVRRLDTHHHFGSPEWVAMTKAKQTAGWQTWTPYTPAKAVESMDMGECQTSLISITTPGIWFGNLMETRKLARYAKRMKNRSLVQRLGYFLEKGGLLPNAAAALRPLNRAVPCLLDPTVPRQGKLNERWHVVENVSLSLKEWK